MTLDFTRRSALHILGAGASLGAGIGTSIGALAGSSAANTALSDFESFAQSSRKNPWTLGWRSVSASDMSTAKLRVVSGKIPTGLSGTFYRNGPALFERDGLRLHHWFDGDGMVHAYHINADGVSHTGRMVRTGKYVREEKAGRFLASAFGTKIDNPAPISGPDDFNAANTSVLPIGGELLALWEGGSAYRLDDMTLETLGAKTWGKGLKGMPFSAHPKVDTDGTVWNFGQDVFHNRLLVYKIHANGELAGVHLLKNVAPGMIHDFCMTKRHLIFVVPSFQAVQQSDTFLGKFKWLPQEGQRVIVVEKDNLDARREYELPPGFQFHYGNAWEDNAGDIRFSVCAGDDSFITKGATAVMRGEKFEPTPTYLAHVVLYKNGKARVEKLSKERAAHEFPQFNSNVMGENARYLYTVGDSFEDGPGQSSILKHDFVSGKITGHNYGQTTVVEEHLFLARPGSSREDDGWLIGTTLNLEAQRTQINIIDAAHIEDGPVCILELPYALPLGFHGAWKATA